MPLVSLPVLDWSENMQNLYNELVVELVKSHKLTKDRKAPWLGYDISVISNDILEKGRADFSKGYDGKPKLSPADKTLLYCFCSLRRHLFESTYKRYEKQLKPLFGGKEMTMVIDLGCGPGTACLAFAEFLKQHPFEYVGLDIARPMRDKARELIDRAIKTKVLARDSTRFCTSSPETVLAQVSKSRPEKIVINTTYLFASDSLDVTSIVEFVTSVRKMKFVKELHMVYTNSSDERAIKKYNEFWPEVASMCVGKELFYEGEKIKFIPDLAKRWYVNRPPSPFDRDLLKFKGS